MHKHRFRGYIYILGSALLWGLSAAVGRWSLKLPAFQFGHSSTQTVVILSQMRMTLALLALVPYLFIRHRKAFVAPLSSWMQAMVLGSIGIALTSFTFYFAMLKTSVATAVALQNTAPLWVVGFNWIKGESRKPREIYAAILAMLGVSCVVFSQGLNVAASGVVIGLISALCFAVYNIGARQLIAKSGQMVTLLQSLCGAAIFWLIVSPPWTIPWAQYHLQQWLFLWGFALVSVLIPNLLYFRGLQYIGATQAVIVSCFNPVFAVLFAIPIAHESLHIGQAIGVVAVLSATLLARIKLQRNSSPLPNSE